MNPSIEWRDVGGRKFLFLTFDGHLMTDDARQAVNSLYLTLAGASGPQVMVWECSRMTGYESGAREIWQAFIKEAKPRLAGIHLVSSNSMIRVGASVVSIFAGIKITTWASLAEFEARV